MDAPDGLDAGGSALWTALSEDGMSEPRVALLTEACRARDRLDRFDRLLRGDIDNWTELVQRYSGDDTRLVVDDALVKANATAGLLKNLLAALPDGEITKPKGTALDEFTKRRAAKGAPSRPARASSS